MGAQCASANVSRAPHVKRAPQYRVLPPYGTVCGGGVLRLEAAAYAVRVCCVLNHEPIPSVCAVCGQGSLEEYIQSIPLRADQVKVQDWGKELKKFQGAGEGFIVPTQVVQKVSRFPVISRHRRPMFQNPVSSPPMCPTPFNNHTPALSFN